MLNTKLFPILPTLLTSVALLSACAGTDTTIDEDPPQNQNQEQEQVETTETTDTSENTDTSETISLAVLGTTDIHAHLLPYDYMNDEVEESIGLSKVYTLVEEAREEFDHTLLVDNGDIIQGSILGDTQVDVNPVAEDETHVVMEAMNEMGYDSATLGNHEFNFGLDFLNGTIADAEFPWLSANLVEPGTETPVYDPYILVEDEINGNPLTVGVIGFVPPGIMGWDAQHLEGEVEVLEMVDAAEMYVPEMIDEGADLVIAVAHSGIDDGDDQSDNAAITLSEVERIDGMILGHNHGHFPMEGEYEAIEGIDVEAGTINGVQAAMPGSWGSYLGVLSYDLTFEDGEWQIESGASEIRSTEEAESHEAIEEIAQEVHEETVEYVNSPVGELAETAHTYFARVESNEVVQLVNDAQLAHTEQLKEDGELEEDLPILSAGAPFRAGRDGEYTYISEGEISIGDMNDVYVYPNTLVIVEVNGDQLKNWLEFSALNFNQIDPDNDEDQYLVNEEERSYNFDTIANVTYEFDVTQEAGNRVQNLAYEGEPVDSEDRFYVATNNHRASGDALDEDVIIALETRTENRQIIIDYVINHEGPLDLEADQNWTIAPFEPAGNVLFSSSPNAVDYYGNYERIELHEEGADAAQFLYE